MDQVSQRLGGLYFHIRAIFKDIHYEFPAIRERDLKLIFSIYCTAFLLRMPLHVDNPGYYRLLEPKNSCFLGCAGKYSIRAGEKLVKPFIRVI